MMGGLLEEEMYDLGEPSIIKEEEIREIEQYLALDVKRVVGRIQRKARSGESHPRKEEVLNSMYDSIAGLTMGVKGSNNWVIAGKFTQSGAPMMGSDPHLDNGIPTHWHLSEVNFMKDGKEQVVVGASMPGIPCFIIGRNNNLIFSVTVLMQDNSDAFLETVDHATGSYLHNNTWVPLEQ